MWSEHNFYKSKDRINILMSVEFDVRTWKNICHSSEDTLVVSNDVMHVFRLNR